MPIMSEKILTALMQLFALIAVPYSEQKVRESVVFNYLKEKLNTELAKKYLQIYLHYYHLYQKRQSKSQKNKFIAVSSVKLLAISTILNKELTQKEKYIVLIRLLEFIKSEQKVSDQALEFVATVAETFRIPNSDFDAIRLFVFKKPQFFELYQENILIIAQNPPEQPNIKFIFNSNLTGRIIILFLSTVNLHIFMFEGEKELYLNQHLLTPNTVYIFSYGSSLRNRKIRPIYYSDIVSAFTYDKIKNFITLEADRISYTFPNGTVAINQMSFIERSGKLVGILGASGSGKTTLLNILNGNYKPDTGSVYINGIDIFKEKEQIHGLIGYVPQEDFLVEELTVFENLYFNAKLSFGDYNDFRIKKEVIKILKDLGLYEIKDHIVGSPLNRQISGGQRKRLNIALELIRQPPILFLDEPTSGLSSTDSENIMDLLKELTLKGKLIITVIHQPSSDIYKMFDRVLILDQGGYLIYDGPPIEAISYFKSAVRQADWSDSECPVCGTVKSEEIFKIVEAKILDEFGRPTAIRRISPKEWYEHFKTYLIQTQRRKKLFLVRDLPEIPFKIPNKFKQFKLFAARDLLVKLRNIQYILINLFETPVLAFLLSFIIRYWNPANYSHYIFFYNNNLPVYLFTSVIIAIFIGISVSAQEIIKDREIRQREAFLNLSWGSYLMSKLFILFFISAFQAFTYVIIGNTIMQIKGMYFKYWLILFSIWFSGNIMGLIISDTFKSTATIYITIPFLIIPQLILSGVLVPFDQLNPKISSPVSIPWYGEAMSARWGYEALAVTQFKDNKYEKLFYDFDRKLSNASYVKDYWVPQLNTAVNIIRIKLLNHSIDSDDLLLLRNELSADYQWNNIFQRNFKLSELQPQNINLNVLDSVNVYLDAIKNYYIDLYNKTAEQKNNFILGFKQKYGKDSLINLKLAYMNEKLSDFVRCLDRSRIIEYHHRLYRKVNPIFFDGEGWLIKSHFYAPYKQLFGHKVSTFWVNTLVIWLQSLLLFIILYYRLIYKGLFYLSILISKVKLPQKKEQIKQKQPKLIKKFFAFWVK